MLIGDPSMVDTPLARDGRGLEFAKALADVVATLLGEDSSFTTSAVYAADGVTST